MMKKCNCQNLKNGDIIKADTNGKCIICGRGVLDWSCRDVLIGEPSKNIDDLVLLFLNKLEIMTDEERKTIIKAIQIRNNPMFIVDRVI